MPALEAGRTSSRRSVLEFAILAAATSLLWLSALHPPQQRPDLRAELRAARAAVERRLQWVELEQAVVQLQIEVRHHNFAAAAPLADRLFYRLERAALEAGPFSPLRRALRLRGHILARLEAGDAGVLSDLERLERLVQRAARSR